MESQLRAGAGSGPPYTAVAKLAYAEACAPEECGRGRRLSPPLRRVTDFPALEWGDVFPSLIVLTSFAVWIRCLGCRRYQDAVLSVVAAPGVVRSCSPTEPRLSSPRLPRPPHVAWCAAYAYRL